MLILKQALKRTLLTRVSVGFLVIVAQLRRCHTVKRNLPDMIYVLSC